MQRHGYIGEFEIVDDHRSGKIVVELLGIIEFLIQDALTNVESFHLDMM
jgi:ribosomal protein S8